MTRKDILRKIVELGLTRNKAKIVLETFLSIINETLQSKRSVKISGFGTFYVKNKPAKRGTNPKTGETIQIPEKKYPAFRASSELRKGVNK